jgi:hypothetical protein
MRKGLIAVIVAGALFAIGAFAASFSLSAEDVSSGADAVAACGANAEIHWHISTSGAAVTTTTAVANFKITGYDIAAGVACGSRDYRLVIATGAASQVLCSGSLGTPSAGLATNESVAARCNPTANINVNDVTGAALLIGDQSFALQTP